MEPDMLVSLKNGQKYGILLESEETKDDYFLAVLLDEQEEPTNTYAVLEKVESDGRQFVRKVEDPLILNELLTDYQSQYEDLLAA